MDILQNLGYVAGLCTTIAFIPPGNPDLQTRHAGDISYAMLILLISGVSLWLIYGSVIDEGPVIIANGVTLVLLLILTIMKRAFT